MLNETNEIIRQELEEAAENSFSRRMNPREWARNRYASCQGRAESCARTIEDLEQCERDLCEEIAQDEARNASSIWVDRKRRTLGRMRNELATLRERLAVYEDAARDARAMLDEEVA
jgi:hypothetical protein